MKIRFITMTTIMVLLVFLFGSTVFIEAYDKTYTVYMVGQGHQDTGWLWDWPDTINQITSTINTQLTLMNNNSDFRFTYPAMLHYKFLSEYDQTMYNNVKQRITEGKWEVAGGQWVEPDANLTWGESAARQFLVGKRYARSQLGVDPKMGYLPDTFGHPHTMPQILSKSGMDCFVYTKFSGSWGYLSNWSAPDGTSILLINSDMYNADPASVDYNAQIDKVTPYGLKIAMRTYGNGDQGGGPNQTMVNTIHSKDTTAGIPAVKCKTLLNFYDDIKNNLSSIGSWNDELYYASGRGIYSNNAAGKYLLRKNDVKIEQTEKFGYIAKWLGGTGYQTEKFNKAWDVTLSNEFHDHIYGTHSCNAVVNREIDMYGVSSNILDNTLNYSLDAITKRADTNVGSGSVPVIVYNPLSWTRNDLVETSVTFASAPSSVRVYDYQTGAEVPTQVLSINGNTAKILFEANNVPSIGYKVFKATAATAGSYSTGLSIGSNVIENNFIRATISGSTGNFSSVYLKGAAWEAVGSGKQANELHLLVDTDVARNLIQSEMEATPTLLNSPQSISVIESGPVRAIYRVTKQTPAGSPIVQDITMYSNIDRVDIKNSVDWNEQHKMLKAAFNLNVNVTQCTYEIPYGNLNRSVTDTAKFEVSGHKWADMTSGGYGVSILNDSKYGWDDTSNRIRLSLLRSPNANATGYEVGHYDYTYSIYPHSGDWKTANTVKEANELNYPLIVTPTTQHTGVLGNTFSFASVDQPNVMITAIKKAEDSADDLVIRLVEVNGVTTTNYNVTFAGNVTNARKINLIEDDQGAQSYSGNQLSASVGKYGIHSFRVTVSSPNYSDTKPTSNIVSLTSSYNLDGITQNSARTSGNIDGNGNSLPAELMPATVISEDIQFNLAGSEGNNMVQCTGQTVTLPQGNYQSLQLLVLSAGGVNVESGTFQVNYTDSTNSSAVLGIRDWTTKALTWGSPVIADNIATYITHRHTSSSDDKCKWVYMFKYAIALNGAKTTSSITLPNNNKIKILAMTLSNQILGPTPTPAPTPTPGPTPTPNLDLCNGGTPSASAVQTGQTAAEAFDDNFTTSKWIAAATTAWIQYRFGGGNTYVVTRYTLTSGNDLPGRDPKNWQFQGSNNGSSWTTLDTRTGVTFASRLLTQSFSFTNSTAYNYYRVNITLNNGDAKTCLEEVEMFGGSAATPTPTPTATPTATPTPTPAGTATPTPTPGGQVIVSLTSSFNEDDFSYDTNRANGDYDGLGASYPAEQTTTNPTFESTTYQIGPLTDGSNNGIRGTGQVINLPQGQYSSIRFLGAATNGNKTGTFRITYTDSTYTDVSVTQLDWRTTGSVAAEKVVETMTHKHTPTGDSTIRNTYIFGYYLTPTAGKTVMSLTLPNNTGMHVLAITLVP